MTKIWFSGKERSLLNYQGLTSDKFDGILFLAMKKDIHPSDYRPVVFQDSSTDTTFLTKSTAKTKEIIKLDGVEYPLVKIHISSASHPFYTGEEKIVDIEGRVDRFKARQAAADKQREALANKAKKVAAKKEASSKKDSSEKVEKVGAKVNQSKPKTEAKPKTKANPKPDTKSKPTPDKKDAK